MEGGKKMPCYLKKIKGQPKKVRIYDNFKGKQSKKTKKFVDIIKKP